MTAIDPPGPIHGRATLPVLSVDLEAVAVAFGLPRALQVVSHHPGADGTWRARAGRDNFAVKVIAGADDWSRTQITRQGQLELAAAGAGVAMPEILPPMAPALGLCAAVDGHLVEVHRWVDTLPGDTRVDHPALHGWLGRTLALLHGLVPLGRDEDGDVAHAYAVHPLADWASGSPTPTGSASHGPPSVRSCFTSSQRRPS